MASWGLKPKKRATRGRGGGWGRVVVVGGGEKLSMDCHQLHRLLMAMGVGTRVVCTVGKKRNRRSEGDEGMKRRGGGANRGRLSTRSSTSIFGWEEMGVVVVVVVVVVETWEGRKLHGR